MKKIGILMALILFVSIGTNAQETVKVKTVKIKTTAICGMCKDRIEKKLNYTKGVIFAELNIDTKIVEIKYKTKLLDEAKLKAIIAKLGYDADDTKKDEEAYAKLPKCCRSSGHCD